MNGQFMGGTEAMWLAGFQGRLYAGIGYGQDKAGNDPQPGAQILHRDAAGSPWRVDHAFGPGFMRVEALVKTRFTTDYTEKKPSEPAERGSRVNAVPRDAFPPLADPSSGLYAHQAFL
jgi:hypothetical protein